MLHPGSGVNSLGITGSTNYRGLRSSLPVSIDPLDAKSHDSDCIGALEAACPAFSCEH